jgi:ComF family protein
MLIQALHRLIHTILFTQEETLVHCTYSSSPTALFSYKDSKVRRIIWDIKYRGNAQLVNNAGLLLFQRLKEIKMGSGAILAIILIPVPVSKKRLRQRGHNQADLLVKAIMKHDTMNIFEYGGGAVVKIRDTISQTELSREKRKQNLIGVFCVAQPEKVRGRRVVVIDDVTTTGATLSEVTKVLQDAGVCKVSTLVLAH